MISLNVIFFIVTYSLKVSFLNMNTYLTSEYSYQGFKYCGMGLCQKFAGTVWHDACEAVPMRVGYKKCMCADM